MQKIEERKCFGGLQQRFEHKSTTLDCEMRFSVFLPSSAQSRPVPVVYFLSGLTCSDQNFVQKAGAQQCAEQYGIALVAPDTSPRGEGVPDDADAADDFGLGAGFYLNATEARWAKHFKMYDYVVDELPALVGESLPIDTTRQGIFGHSMGGHGALVLGLRNPDRYRSISAFAPICAPSQCPWGQKAFAGYLGDDRAAWAQYDATELIEAGAEKRALLVDQGTADPFLEKQLHPHLLEKACAESDHPLQLRMQEGYDHSYYFIATFVDDHLAFHAKALHA